MMRLHLGGHLSWYDSQKRSWLDIQLVEPMVLSMLVKQLGLPIAEIAVAAVNGQLVAMDEVHVMDSDRVELFPPIGGG